MKKIMGIVCVLLACLFAVSMAACSEKKGWTRNDTASLGGRDAVRLSNDETPSADAPVTGTFFLIKTDNKDEFIIGSLELKLFGENYLKNSKTGGLTIENGSGRSYSHGNIKASFAVYTNSATNQEQDFFTLRFSLDYEDDEGEPQNTYTLDESEDMQLKVTLNENITIKFSYTDKDNSTQQFEYTIVAADIKKA